MLAATLTRRRCHYVIQQVPYETAVKVALRVKKELVDADSLDVSQVQLEAVVFRVLRKRAFGDDVVSRYRLLNAFHVRRTPLVVLVCGGLCTGKSTLAAKLSEVRWHTALAFAQTHSLTALAPPTRAAVQRLNLPNVLQTDIVHQACLH